MRDRPGRAGVAERLAVPLKPGNAGGGKGPQFKTDAGRSEEMRLLRGGTDGFVDSPLEGTGFEPSVPPRKRRPSTEARRTRPAILSRI